jgi:hypothetical protein
MVRTKTEDDAAAIVEAVTDESANGDGATRPTVAKGMRPVFSEIARLSATLSVARTACYEGDTVKAVRALNLLARQLPLAQEMAELLAPAE